MARMAPPISPRVAYMHFRQAAPWIKKYRQLLHKSGFHALMAVMGSNHFLKKTGPVTRSPARFIRLPLPMCRVSWLFHLTPSLQRVNCPNALCIHMTSGQKTQTLRLRFPSQLRYGGGNDGSDGVNIF